MRGWVTKGMHLQKLHADGSAVTRSGVVVEVRYGSPDKIFESTELSKLTHGHFPYEIREYGQQWLHEPLDTTICIHRGHRI